MESICGGTSAYTGSLPLIPQGLSDLLSPNGSINAAIRHGSIISAPNVVSLQFSLASGLDPSEGIQKSILHYLQIYLDSNPGDLLLQDFKSDSGLYGSRRYL